MYTRVMEKSNYLYHRVPGKMQWKYLMPWNTLKVKHPEIADKCFKKYEDRQWLTKKKIELFDCLWNDVLFFSGVHPDKFLRHFRKNGRATKKRLWYEIPLEDFDSEKLWIIDWSWGKAHAFNEILFSESQVLSKKTLEYYKKQFKEGKNALILKGTPHIVYHGTVDVSTAKKLKI